MHRHAFVEEFSVVWHKLYMRLEMKWTRQPMTRKQHNGPNILYPFLKRWLEIAIIYLINMFRKQVTWLFLSMRLLIHPRHGQLEKNLLTLTRTDLLKWWMYMPLVAHSVMLVRHATKYYRNIDKKKNNLAGEEDTCLNSSLRRQIVPSWKVRHFFLGTKHFFKCCSFASNLGSNTGQSGFHVPWVTV